MDRLRPRRSQCDDWTLRTTKTCTKELKTRQAAGASFELRLTGGYSFLVRKRVDKCESSTSVLKKQQKCATKVRQKAHAFICSRNVSLQDTADSLGHFDKGLAKDQALLNGALRRQLSIRRDFYEGRYVHIRTANRNLMRRSKTSTGRG